VGEDEVWERVVVVVVDLADTNVVAGIPHVLISNRLVYYNAEPMRRSAVFLHCRI
jgi:hypothetical protein